MARPQKRKLSKKEIKASAKADIAAKSAISVDEQVVKKEIKKRDVVIPQVLTVKEFADRSGIPVTSIITELIKSGVLATINESIDFETAAIIGDDLGIRVVKEEAGSVTVDVEEASSTATSSAHLVPRPPIVTVMGHVDHGKTSLLDQIRKAHVASGESGGITQHISAYQLTLEKTKQTTSQKTITFIDTPGHAAFSAMRSHGAAITDIAVVIVAADDGVMPQTAEVIEAAQDNNVPIIIAINKIDLPDADIMKVKQQLSEYNLVPEEWGGKTIMVEVSARTGQGIDSLLEMILLQAEMMSLVANPDDKAVGIVIESQMVKGAGATATVLIENGTLRRGDPVSIGPSFGKARSITNFLGQDIKEATPSMPIRIAGLKSLPGFGDRMVAFENEKEARVSAQKYSHSTTELKVATAKKYSETGDDGESKKIIEINLVIKADVAGSLSAISKSISEINQDGFTIRIIAEGVGAISESDASLAIATKAMIYGFRVDVSGAAQDQAEKNGIIVRTFKVIYELIDAIKADVSELLPLEIIEEELAHGKVLAIFRDDKKGVVAGGSGESGKVTVGDEVKILQNGNEKYRAKISSLRREKSEVKEVTSGTEFGFSLPAFANIAVGDEYIVFKTISKKRIVS